MGRLDYFIDRAMIQRASKKKVRGDVVEIPATDVGDWIPCLLRNIAGKEVFQAPRTMVPESAILILHVEDDSGNPVVVKQGDTLLVKYSEDDTLNQKPKAFKILGDIKKIRRNSEVTSIQLEVTMHTEH